MYRFLLPIYLIRLKTSLAWFLANVFIQVFPLTAISLVLSATLVSGAFYWTKSEKTIVPPLTNTTRVEMAIKKHEQLLELQPSHRDVLYNLSVLHQFIGDQEKSKVYFEKSKSLDPNHSLFSESEL